jgi:hypothetical protein
MDKPPQDKTKGDIARDVGRAAVSLVPVVGGPAQVVFENVFTAPLEKRKQAWLEQLAIAVEELQARIKDLTPEKLAENEVFVTVTMQASQIALRNHQQSKLDALRNAVVNSALPNSPEENEQLIFLRLVDQLTPLHVRVLSLLNDPASWMAVNNMQNPGWGMGGVSTVVEYCLPEVRGRKETYEQVVRDLQSEGLLSQGQFLNVTMTGGGMLQSRSTERGKQFMKFISAPQ